MTFFAKARTTSRDIETELFPLWLEMERAVRERQPPSGPTTYRERVEAVWALPEVQAAMGWVEARLFIDIRMFRSTMLKCLASSDVERARRLLAATFPVSYSGPAIAVRTVFLWLVTSGTIGVGLLAVWRLLFG